MKKKKKKKLTVLTPAALCLKVVDKLIEGITAPVTGSGSCPTWTARVEKPKSSSDKVGLLVFIIIIIIIILSIHINKR